MFPSARAGRSHPPLALPLPPKLSLTRSLSLSLSLSLTRPSAARQASAHRARLLVVWGTTSEHPRVLPAFLSLAAHLGCRRSACSRLTCLRPRARHGRGALADSSPNSLAAIPCRTHRISSVGRKDLRSMYGRVRPAQRSKVFALETLGLRGQT